jgi:parvulin-like peptidyl-prolyl isomerase
MKRGLLLLLAVLICVSYFGCDKNGTEGTVIARVNKSSFTLEELEEQIPPFMTVPPERKKDFVDEWISTEVVYQEALKKGLNKDQKVKRQMDLLVKQYLANELLQRRLENEGDVTDFEVKEYYQEHERDFNSQIKIAHILLSTEAEAKKIHDKLKAGEDFITLARTFSLDSVTAPNGGLIIDPTGKPRYFTFGEMFDTPEFEKAAFGIDRIGGYSDIVSTDFGFHIIKLVDRKPTREKVKLEDVAAPIKEYLRSIKQKSVMDSWLDSLKTLAEIETHYEVIK